MNSIDSKISKALKLLHKQPLDIQKSEQARKQLSDLLTKARKPELTGALSWAIEQSPSKAAEFDKSSLLDSSVAARNAGLPETAAVLLAVFFEAGGELDRERALRVCANAESMDLWRKKSATPAKELEDYLLVELADIYATAGVEWLIEHGDVKKLDLLFRRLLQSEDRPNFLPNWHHTLSKVLFNDSKGVRLEALLRAVDSADLAKTLANVVIQKDLINQALDQLARLAAGSETIHGIPILIDEIVRLTFDADGSEREWLSAALTKLVGGIALQNENSSQADAVLSKIERANRKLKTAICSSGATGKVWSVIRFPDNQDTPSGKPQLTIEGALNIASAFRKAAEGFGTIEILTFTAKNLGMTQFGTVSESVVFNPFQHEDIAGVLLRGDKAIITESGWKLGNDIAMRAKVKGAKP